MLRSIPSTETEASLWRGETTRKKTDSLLLAFVEALAKADASRDHEAETSALRGDGSEGR